MDYPNPGLLINVDWLRDHLKDESFVLVDVRAGESYASYWRAHIPGARPFSLAHTEGLAGGTPECLIEEAMTWQLETLGITPDQTVVLYDDCWSTRVTKSFWAFERVGQRAVRVLDGGLDAWHAAGGELSSDLPRYDTSCYGTAFRECKADAAWIAEHSGSTQLLDVRGVQEWRAAHIAGAINLNWKGFTCGDPATPTLLPAEEAQERLGAFGLSPTRETVTYCRTGGRASFVYFVLRLMGWEQPRNYDGSMTEWLLQERPVEMAPLAR